MARSPDAGVDDGLFGPSGFERALEQRLPARWIGWRLRLLVGAALLGCLGLVGLMRVLAQGPVLDAQWQAGPRDHVVLQASGDPRLAPHLGRTLERIDGAGAGLAVGAALLFGTPRWTVDDAGRAALVQARAALNAVFAADAVTLQFSDGTQVAAPLPARGHAGLGLAFWLLAAPALALYLVAAVVLLARPRWSSALFATMACCQSLNLLWIGVDAGRGLAPIPAWLVDDLPWRLGLDLATAAAAVHVCALYPVRQRAHAAVAGAAWALAGLGTLAAWRGGLPGLWWSGQALLFGLGLGAIHVLSRTLRTEPHPYAAMMRRFAYAVLGTLVAVNGAVVAARWQPTMAYDVATSAVLVWTLFFASLLVWVPFLSRSRHNQVLREFAMLAGLSTVAASLDLLFVSFFALERFASLTLAVFVALGVYSAVRQWMIRQLAGSSLLTTERTFEQLYRVAREVQKHPERRVALLAQLLRGLFEPLELQQVPRAVAHTRVHSDGSALIVPVPGAHGGGDALSLVLRYAQRGRRIFTQEDARLTDRVVEQLRRAVAYDEAVERGRTEERMRIAQDLHDDIGARLLTLMYKAQDPEMEDYLRHTLQDLKTLTRGLAASQHRLSHAVGEWKADLQQRLTAAHVHLSWSFSFDADVELTVVQWSGLTRVLRELVSNTIYHAHATRLDIVASLERGNLWLQVADDGIGRDPQSWSHGLGLGGIRKRVKLLGGEVRWAENGAQGIVCEVRIPGLVARA